ncbi:MAG: Smr/MutS family protein, partial [Bacteroidota bacterium]|nr:Smr/MutS family protein [Bacteroidota bacterium]
NGSLEFNVETLSPTFNFICGVPGQSFTFEIAKKFDFPEKILRDSNKYLDENEGRLEDLLKDLNETKQKYSLLKNKFDLENTRLVGLTNLYESKVKELNKNERELRFRAKLDAEEIIKDANKLVEKTIKEIREGQLTPKEIKDEFRKESLQITKIEDAEEEFIVSDEKIIAGDLVRIKDSNSSGDVMEISNNIVSVNINGLLLKSKINDLEKISRKESIKEFSNESTIEINEGKLELSLDLRGKYSHEIEEALYKFIHDSNQNGLKEVSVIHGKGSGKLREEVKKQLKRSSLVKSFRLGNWNEGDSGVTIIEL